MRGGICFFFAHPFTGRSLVRVSWRAAPLEQHSQVLPLLRCPAADTVDTEHIFSEAALLEAVSVFRFCGSGETVILSESIPSSKISSAASQICTVLTEKC